ncbi:MAG TPA: sensor histidine kinase [Candidatus Binatia bacterium]|nr:sensor histidine kinase [Candidatus Binatia bacterium]
MKNKGNRISLRSTAAVAAVQEERRRISRELHDRVLQLLTSIQLRSELCVNELMGKPEQLEQELKTIAEAAHKAATEIRSLLLEKQPAVNLAAGSLERRLKEEMDIFRARTGLKLKFDCAISAHDLPYEVEQELYFALREGIINTIRHSRATELSLSLTQDQTTCRVGLRDNGVGFDRSLTAGSGGFGLKGMRERIEKVGGQLVIETAPGKGTDITIVVPLRGQTDTK